MTERRTGRILSFLLMLIMVLMFSGVLPAHAGQAEVDKCAQTIAKENSKIIRALTDLYSKCVKAVSGCLKKPVETQAACIMDLQDPARKRACSPLVLNGDDPESKEGEKLKKAEDSIKAKCDDPPLTEPELLDTDLDNPNAKVGFAAARNAMCGKMVGNFDGVIGNIAEVLQCIRLLALKAAAMAVVWDVDPRAPAVVRERIGGAFGNPIPLGTHKVAATVDIDIEHDADTLEVDDLDVKFLLDLGAPTMAGEVAVVVPAASAEYPVVFDLDGANVTMCIKQLADGIGRLCCNAAGCPGLMKKSFDVRQDHDTSGNNLGFLTNEVPPGVADPDCNARKVNTLSNFPPFTTLPCLEAEARLGACNRGLIGEANEFAHHPRCTGGDRVDRPCDPADAANECPGGGGGVCKSKSVGGPALNSSPCIGPFTFINRADDFANGDMLIVMFLQYTFHDEDADDLAFDPPCLNDDDDEIPDGYGCDGIPCTDDDITPPEAPVGFALTTGTTAAKVFDANMVTTALGGSLETDDLGGEVPMNGCRNLSLSVTADYELNAAFPGIDNVHWGDSVTAVHHEW